MALPKKPFADGGFSRVLPGALSQASRWILPALSVLFLFLVRDRLAWSPPQRGALRFAHTFTTESERSILDAAIAEFEQKHPGVRVEQIISNSETYNTLGWRLQFRGRNAPDIYFQWQGFNVEKAIENGWALELSQFLRPEFFAEFLPATLLRQKGGVYFLPHSFDISNLVWYNRHVFDRLGLQEPKSVDEWLAVCVTLRKAQVLPLAQGNRDLWPVGNVGAELLAQSLEPESLKILFDPGQPVTTRSLQALYPLNSLRKSGALDFPGILSPAALPRLSDIDAKVLFLNQRSAQHIVGSWFLADLEDARQNAELKFPAGFFTLPPGEGEMDALTGVTTGFLVHASSAKPREAVEFVALLLSRKYQSQFAQLGTLSARRDGTEFTKDPLAIQMLKLLDQERRFTPPPDTGYAPEQASIFYTVCGKIISGQLSLSDASEYWSREKKRLARKALRND